MNKVLGGHYLLVNNIRGDIIHYSIMSGGTFWGGGGGGGGTVHYDNVIMRS